jgi:hypothetical protein
MKPINDAVPGGLAELLRAAPLSPGKVEFAWKAAVGPTIDRGTSVRLESGVLIVEASSAQWAREIARSIPVILPRLQKLLGADAVSSISLRHA